MDNFKIGNDTKNFSAREVIRFIDKLSANHSLQEWIPLAKNLGKFKVILVAEPEGLNAEDIYARGKNDHKIINAALFLKQNNPKIEVILVTKDINLRIKAKALGINAEDYEKGKVSAELEKLFRRLHRSGVGMKKNAIRENGVFLENSEEGTPGFQTVNGDGALKVNRYIQMFLKNG